MIFLQKKERKKKREKKKTLSPEFLTNTKCFQERSSHVFSLTPLLDLFRKPDHGKHGSLVQIKFIGYYSTNRYLQLFDIWEKVHQRVLMIIWMPNKNQELFERDDRRRTNVSIKQVLWALFKGTKSKGWDNEGTRQAFTDLQHKNQNSKSLRQTPP